MSSTIRVPKFIWVYENINRSQNYQADASDVVFINNGSNDVIINGLQMQQGDSMADSAFGLEYSNTNYSIIFVAGAGTNDLVIKRKKYLGFVNMEL
jgi:hypothetical protein